jgi:AraC family transcriptional regulator
MNVAIEDLPDIHALAVRHVGPYDRISEAFARLHAIVAPAGLFALPNVSLLAVYHDAPEAKVQDLRSDAAISVPAGTPAIEGLTALHIAGGRYARTTHIGPYAQLGEVWSRFLGRWPVESRHVRGTGPVFEVYRNTPEDTAPHELRTDLYMPLA